ncbi:hypothetical protein CL622_04150 [archaeon]|nr:hypothetical protein [archaeon]
MGKSKRLSWYIKKRRLIRTHKKAREKFGVPECKRNETVREGYHRRKYERKDRVEVKSIWVRPGCIKRRGISQKKGLRLGGIGPLKKDQLKKHGYGANVGMKKRRNALKMAVRESSALTVFRRLNAIRILLRYVNPKASKTFHKDMKWVRKHYRKHFKSPLKTKKKKRKKK